MSISLPTEGTQIDNSYFSSLVNTNNNYESDYKWRLIWQNINTISGEDWGGDDTKGQTLTYNFINQYEYLVFVPALNDPEEDYQEYEYQDKWATSAIWIPTAKFYIDTAVHICWSKFKTDTTYNETILCLYDLRLDVPQPWGPGEGYIHWNFNDSYKTEITFNSNGCSYYRNDLSRSDSIKDLYGVWH